MARAFEMDCVIFVADTRITEKKFWSAGACLQHFCLLCGIQALTSTSIPENKVILADVPTIHVLNYGPAMLLVDPFSSGRSTTGEPQIVIQNYVDCLIRDRSLVLVGST